jgi:GNAT superfamily N-acetyltransferase
MITIREARKKDAERILQLIKALALFEKEENAVEVQLDEFIQDGFGENPVYKCIVAEKDSYVVGFALYYIRYSTWKGKTVYLEDFLVDEAYRSQGIGKLLFEEMIRIAKKLNVRQMSWQVLDWNEGAIRFYQKYEAEILEGWLNARLINFK